jgi:hypothetical protein
MTRVCPEASLLGLDTSTDTQKAQRVTLLNQLLLELLSIKYHGWHFVITLNESWFSVSTEH